MRPPAGPPAAIVRATSSQAHLPDLSKGSVFIWRVWRFFARKATGCTESSSRNELLTNSTNSNKRLVGLCCLFFCAPHSRCRCHYYNVRAQSPWVTMRTHHEAISICAWWSRTERREQSTEHRERSRAKQKQLLFARNNSAHEQEMPAHCATSLAPLIHQHARL